MKQTSWKDRIAVLEDKYNQLEDGDYKKKQLWSKIINMKRNHDPKVFWQGKTYRAEVHEGFDEAMKARLEVAHQKDLAEQTEGEQE